MMTIRQRTTIRTALRLLAAVPSRCCSCSDLLVVHDLVQDTEEIYSFRRNVSGRIHFDNYRFCSGWRRGHGMESLVVAGVSTIIAMFLGTICAYSIAASGPEASTWPTGSSLSA